MVKITYQPLKEIVVTEVTHYPSPEALAQNFTFMVRAGQTAALAWADDMVFFVLPVPPTTETMVKEYFEGRGHYASVMFASMSPYKSAIRVNALEIPVIDASTNENARALAEWLKLRQDQSS